MTAKTCNRCGETKPLSEFFSNKQKDRKSTHRPECKRCTKIRVAQAGRNKAAYMRAYRDKNPDYVERNNAKRRKNG